MAARWIAIVCCGYRGGVTADIRRGHRSFNAANAALTEMLERESMDVSDTRYDATILSTNTPRQLASAKRQNKS